VRSPGAPHTRKSKCKLRKKYYYITKYVEGISIGITNLCENQTTNLKKHVFGHLMDVDWRSSAVNIYAVFVLESKNKNGSRPERKQRSSRHHVII
jgi:hypothetical protein